MTAMAAVAVRWRAPRRMIDAPFPVFLREPPHLRLTHTSLYTMKRQLPTESFAFALRVAPTAAVLLAALVLSWREQGSIARGDWLLFAVLVPLLLATVLALSDVTPAI